MKKWNLTVPGQSNIFRIFSNPWDLLAHRQYKRETLLLKMERRPQRSIDYLLVIVFIYFIVPA